MEKILKKQAFDAKQRISSGLWNDPDADNLSKEEKLYLNTRRKALNGLSTVMYKGNRESFFEKVYAIVSSDELVFNPLKRLCDDKTYSGLSPEEKQRYVLKLSRAYVYVKRIYEAQRNG